MVLKGIEDYFYAQKVQFGKLIELLIFGDNLLEFANHESGKNITILKCKPVSTAYQ